MTQSGMIVKRPALSEKDDKLLRDLCVRVQNKHGQGDVTSMYHSLLWQIDAHTNNQEVKINVS